MLTIFLMEMDLFCGSGGIADAAAAAAAAAVKQKYSTELLPVWFIKRIHDKIQYVEKNVHIYIYVFN